MASKKKALRGFTLIELVIVIAVIAILAALLVPTILGQAEKARLSRVADEVTHVGDALKRMSTDSANTNAACIANVQNLPCRTSGATYTAPSPATDPGSCVAACGTGLPSCRQAGLAADVPCWGGPYFGTIPTDPWGTQYQVAAGTAPGTVTVQSFGPDKAAGGGDDSTAKTF